MKRKQQGTAKSFKLQNVNVLSYFEESAIPGLRAYFSHVREGNNREYRTSFARGCSLDEVLHEWSQHLDKVKRDWPSLWEFESDMMSKVGPLSIQKPLVERMDDIMAYYTLISSSAKPISSSAIDSTIKEFSGIIGLRLRSRPATWDKMKKSTNSGCPFFTKRRRVKTVTLKTSILDDGKLMYCTDKHSAILNYCATLGWRGQEGGLNFNDVKQRVVWMFPAVVNLFELRLYQPLIEGCQRKHLVPAWEGMEQVDARITKLFNSKGADQPILCTDFSKFDQHFGPVLQQAAHDLLSRLVTHDKPAFRQGEAWYEGDYTADSWLEHIFPIKYTIPLMYDEGMIITGNHGMGSGSGGTNADETLVHRALQHEAALRVNQQLNPNSQCLGDDGILSYPGIRVEDVIDTYSQHGLDMNVDKQYMSTKDCVYLRRWHHRDYMRNKICVGVYSTYRALGRLCEQERFYDPKEWGPEQVALRQLSILENCKYHPLFEEFVEFCMKRDRYRLGIDIPGFLSNLEKVAQKSMDNMPGFMGYVASLQYENSSEREVGINSWEIVRLLRSKA